MSMRRRSLFQLVSIGCVLAGVVAGCSRGTTVQTPARSGSTSVADEPAPAGALELVFTYGSEKQSWIDDVTRSFNEAEHKTSDGKPIFVRAIPLGSGESIDELLEGRRKAHLTSPASAAFIEIGNAKSRARTGKDLVKSTQNLVLSPVVIAMWKPMAESLGWGERPVGWAEILTLAKEPTGWAAKGHAEWGRFRFGHTHPEYSNSGLISLFAEVYAGAGKTAKLTLDDVESEQVGTFLRDIERAIVHYGSSTGFFGKAMFSGGPEYLSAAVLYENMVIESYDPKHNLTFPIVAIYPKEGTFWSDHPIGVVEREWVTDEHREASEKYIEYLLATEQQGRAMTYGFRPADVARVAGGAARSGSRDRPERAADDAGDAVGGGNRPDHRGVAGAQEAGQYRAGARHFRKHAPGRQDPLRTRRAQELVRMLKDADQFSLLPFHSQPVWAMKNASVKADRERALQQIGGLFPQGGTALYDSVATAYDFLAEGASTDTIDAIVVLSDGADRNSRRSLEQLRDKIRTDPEKPSIRVFTIGYGKDAEDDVLRAIADEAKAKYYLGTNENIREVFKEISTFF